MVGSMGASGNTTSVMAKVSNAIQTVILILVNSNLEKLMVRASILGRMAKYTMMSGIKASNKAMVYGKVSKTIHT